MENFDEKEAGKSQISNKTQLFALLTIKEEASQIDDMWTVSNKLIKYDKRPFNNSRLQDIKCLNELQT